MLSEVIILKADWIKSEELGHLLAALMPANRLALEISLATGLRISDVLAIKTDQLHSCQRRFTITQSKTGKKRRVQLPVELHSRALAMAGQCFVFPHRLDWKRHRTRQAVYNDLKRIAKMWRLKSQISPHTARKVFAVSEYAKTGDLKRVQKLLSHSDEAVTIIYAMADLVTARNAKCK